MKNFHKYKTVSLSVWLTAFLISFSAPLAGFSQTAPPNDNLTNATVLTGTDVTFSGSLKGATLEDSADTAGDSWADWIYYPNYYPTPGSIWWSWTAPATTVLNLEVQQFQYDGEDLASDALIVYAATNTATTPADLQQPPLGSIPLVAGPAYLSLSLPVSAGSNYFIQLVGNSSNYLYTFHLRATNVPVIRKQPLSHTVYSNASTLFYVLAEGLQPRSYQWFFNGTNMPGETAPILAFNNINSNMVGTYSVLVSNATGTVTSQSATLAISPSNIPPVLSAVGSVSNAMSFNLTGEIGRAYLIQSSTNLIDWSAENSFPFEPQVRYAYWVWQENGVFTTQTPLLLSVTNNAPRKYYRAVIYKAPDPEAEICQNNQQQIIIAKLLWALDNQTYGHPDTPPFTSLKPYLPHPSTVICPKDSSHSFVTSYNINDLGTAPACLISSTNHVLSSVVP